MSTGSAPIAGALPAGPSRKADSPLHRASGHESGLRHTAGEALYVDDLPPPPGMLVSQILTSPHPHAKVLRRDAAKARKLPGVVAVLFAEDIPGHRNIGPVLHDEALLASSEVLFVGHSVALVLGETYAACRAALAAIEVDYEPQPAILTMAEARAAGAFFAEPHVISRGDVDRALSDAPLVLSGEFRTGGQDHFYLETQVALAIPEEGPALRIYSSSQHPSEVQAVVAEVLGWGRHQIVVEVPRMGGGFGGKETQAAPFAALAALAALHTGRPVKLWLNRDQDMVQTGKRHPFESRFQAGFDRDGSLLGLRAELYSNGGYSMDLSQAILDRALFHLDNAYWIPALHFTGLICKTNLPSNTAFRGFGGPQGIAVMEEVLNRGAERLGLDPTAVRRRNFYGAAPRNRTPYDQEVKDNRLERIYDELLESSSYSARRQEIQAFNSRSGLLKRGIAFQPVKFGISFTTSFLNQAGALVVMYADGSVQLNHGGTEMGQGLHTKMLAVCAHELGVPLEKIRVMGTSTEKVPNTSATAASSGSDLNGQAVKEACTTLRERLRPLAAKALELPEERAVEIEFARGFASWAGRTIDLPSLAQRAYLAQVQLSATGYYRTPDIWYDRKAGRGHPFHYFAYGGAVVEVEVSGLTGEHRMTRVDILHDVGSSLVPSIDKGQVEGGFIQGVGWLTCEEVLFDASGRLLTHSPDTYKIPAVGDTPVDFRVDLLQGASQPEVIHGSKAVGEPPLMLALGVVTALRQAVGAFAQGASGGDGASPVDLQLDVPCTPEAILMAIERTQSR